MLVLQKPSPCTEHHNLTAENLWKLLYLLMPFTTNQWKIWQSTMKSGGCDCWKWHFACWPRHILQTWGNFKCLTIPTYLSWRECFNKYTTYLHVSTSLHGSIELFAHSSILCLCLCRDHAVYRGMCVGVWCFFYFFLLFFTTVTCEQHGLDNSYCFMQMAHSFHAYIVQHFTISSLLGLEAITCVKEVSYHVQQLADNIEQYFLDRPNA